MSIVDNEYHYYKCPHCEGEIELSVGWYHDDGAYFYIYHKSPDEEVVELKEKEERK